jgi:hypothetical protein
MARPGDRPQYRCAGGAGRSTAAFAAAPARDAASTAALLLLHLGGYPVGVVLREPDARRDAAYSAGERGLQRVAVLCASQYPTVEDASR